MVCTVTQTDRHRERQRERDRQKDTYTKTHTHKNLISPSEAYEDFELKKNAKKSIYLNNSLWGLCADERQTR